MFEKYKTHIMIYLILIILFNIVICYRYFKFKENFNGLNGFNSFDKIFVIKENHFKDTDEGLSDINKTEVIDATKFEKSDMDSTFKLISIWIDIIQKSIKK